MTTTEPATTGRAAQLRAELRRWNSRATQLKLDLHDLAEDLPVGWEGILELAAATHEAFATVDRIQRELQAGTASTITAAPGDTSP